ncbi:MAG: tetratricopeptide repeat protein, partial [Gammaproteobacteria bacterium]|nr:tetratricopeptide repeat protein [Gammaproteobacteria bacterium]
MRELHFKTCSKVALGLLLLAITLSRPTFAGMDIAWGDVQDPRLREAIYDLEEEDYFEGIVRLVTNRNFIDANADKDNVNLLLVALYLGYGMPDEAKELLSEELDKNGKLEVQNALWLKLAQARYQRGQFADAATALTQVRGKLLRETEIERRLLYALVLIQQKQPKQAAEVLNVIDLKGSVNSTAFVRYNLAVALLKLNRTSEAMEQLKLLSEMSSSQKDLLALRDQALITAGYALLKNKDPAQAKNYLEQVRLDGTLSGRAMLGLGWAYSIMDKHKLSIAAWSELSKRNISDPAALEATLAIPYAYSKLQAFRQAAEHYETAIAEFVEADKKLEALMLSVRGGKALEVILKQGPMSHPTAMQEYRKVTDPADLQFLAPLLMSFEFQEAHRNYQDMQTLSKKVQQWINALEKAKNVSPSFRESYMGRLVKY